MGGLCSSYVDSGGLGGVKSPQELLLERLVEFYAVADPGKPVQEMDNLVQWAFTDGTYDKLNSKLQAKYGCSLKNLPGPGFVPYHHTTPHQSIHGGASQSISTAYREGSSGAPAAQAAAPQPAEVIVAKSAAEEKEELVDFEA